MKEPRHPYSFPPLQEKLTAAVMILAGVIFVLNVFMKVTSSAVMIPLIALMVIVYIASLIAGKMKK